MFEFPVRTTLVCDAFCPACARVVQEQDKRVIYRRGVLCPQHRAHFAALLRDSCAAQQSVYHWLQFLRTLE